MNANPSRELHADFYGKHGDPISWEVYRERYLEEMKAQHEAIAGLAELVAEGKTITLLCSSACTDAERCQIGYTQGAVTLLVTPVAATLFAWMLLGEGVGPLQVIGGAGVLAGIVLARQGSMNFRVNAYGRAQPI